MYPLSTMFLHLNSGLHIVLGIDPTFTKVLKHSFIQVLRGVVGMILC